MSAAILLLLVLGCRDPRVWDADGDGVTSMAHGGPDCNDAVATIAPGLPEICNGIDDDCDGLIDEISDVDLSTGIVLAVDDDGDGHGDPERRVAQCAPSPGLVVSADDCDDTNPTVHPGAPDACDGVDNDCSGTPDDGESVPLWFVDADGDGFGTTVATTHACTPPAGHAANSDDCNDADAGISPDAEERCSGRDDDCDGLVDDADPDPKPDDRPWFVDADADGFGIPTGAQVLCDPPPSFAATIGDCDDANPGRYPGAAEICDQVDQDCDGAVDEEPADGQTVYADFDGDGYGVREAAKLTCDPITGFSSQNGDCADALAAVHPGATEACNGIDDDCDGNIDDADDSVSIGRIPHYFDADGDGYGTVDTSSERCTPGGDWVADDRDCNDTTSTVNPAAPEVCNNGIDDNCDDTPSPCGFRDLHPSTHSLSSLAQSSIQSVRSDNYWSEVWDIHPMDLDGDGNSELLVLYDGWIIPPIEPGNVVHADDWTVRLLNDASYSYEIADVNHDGQPELLVEGRLGNGPNYLKAALPFNGLHPIYLNEPLFGITNNSQCPYGVGSWYPERSLPGAKGYALVGSGYRKVIPLGPEPLQGTMTTCEFQAMTIAEAPAVRLAFGADFSGDGLDELYIDTRVDTSTSQVLYRFDNPSGPMTPETADASFSFARGISVLSVFFVDDLDGDGRDDLVGRGTFPGSVDTFILSGDVLEDSDGILDIGHFTRLPTDQSSSGVQSGDFDGDGETDLVISERASMTMDVFHGPFTPGEERLSEGGMQLLSLGYVFVADVNVDGVDDIAVDQFEDGTIRVLYGGRE